MSWDVMIFNLGGKQTADLEHLPESEFKPLGPGNEVRKQILSFLPGVEWTDPTWGLYVGNGFSLEFNVGHDDPIKDMMLHVRGGGDAIAAFMSFVVPLGWAALDCSTSEFLEPQNPSQEGWKGFQDFRDRALAEHEYEEEG